MALLASCLFWTSGGTLKADPVHVVDLLLLGDPTVVYRAGGDDAFEQLAAAATARANLVFQNSGANVRLRLAGADTFDWPNGSHLSLLAEASGHPELTRLRDVRAADLVCWVSASAYDGQVNGLPGPSAGHAFSALTLEALQVGLLPAALAPNFGCQVGREAATGLPALPYGYGFRYSLDGQTYGTIESGAPFRVPFFSSPLLQHRGITLGIPEGQPNAADNVRVLNATAPVVARFRGEAPRGTSPGVFVHAPAAGSVLNAGEAVPVAVTVSAAGPTNRVERVDLFDGNRRVESRGIASDQGFVWFDWVPGPEHEAALYFVVTDSVGVSAVSTPLNYPVKAVNDSFAHRTMLTGENLTVQTDLRDTTIEPDEPPFLSIVSPDTGSLWWSWAAPAHGQVMIRLAPKGFPSVVSRLTAYVGESLHSLLPFTTDSFDFLNSGSGLELRFDVVAGEVVQLQAVAESSGPFGPAGDQRGLVELRLNFSAAPPNDHYRHRERLTGSAVDVPVNLAGATAESWETPGRSAWWTWQAPFHGYAIWSGSGDFDPVVTEAYGNNQVPLPRPSGQQWGPLRFRVFEGSTMDLAARWPWGGSLNGLNGQTTLHLRLAPFATNDFSSQATLLTGLSCGFTGNLAQATTEADDSLYAPATLWWRWTAPETGIFLVHPLSGHDLRAYLDLENPVPVAAVESAYTNAVAYRAEAGRTYLIRAEGLPTAANPVVEGRLRLSTVWLGSSVPDWQLTTGVQADFAVYEDEGDGQLQAARLFLDGEPFATLTAPPWRVIWTNPVPGEHRLTAQVFNTAGEPLAVAPVTLAVRPVNDRFAHATVTQGDYWEVDTGAAEASLEPGEPGDDPRPHSLWWRWTAPVAGPVRLRLPLGSRFGQPLQRVTVFTGTELASLSEVPLTETSDTERDFSAVAGQEYRIRVVSAPAAWEAPYRGQARLELTGVPLNDAHANALLVAGSVTEFAGNTTLATRELSDRDAAGNNVAATVWWKWVAPESRTVVVTVTDEGNTPRVSVFEQPRVAVAGNHNPFGGLADQFVFSATAGRTYYFMAAEGFGRGRVRIGIEQRLLHPNDDPAQAIELTGMEGLVEGDNLGASITPDEPADLRQLVWYRFVPLQAGLLQVSVSSGNQFARAAAFTGGPGTWVRRAQTREDDVYAPFTVTVTPGIPVFLGVGTRSAREQGGQFLLHYAYGARPVNDDFETRLVLAGAPVELSVSPFGSTFQEAAAGGPAVEDTRPDLWFEWTAPASGLARLSGSSEAIGNRFMVFAGNDPASLASVPVEYVNGLAWPAREGQAYQLRFLGEPPYTFEGRLELLPAPVNDAFARRTLLVGDGVTFTSTPLLGTLEPGEPRHGPTDFPAYFGYGHTLWYSWVAPGNGVAALEVLQAFHDVRAAVYTGESLASLQPAVFAGTLADVNFDVIAGRTYHLALDAKSPAPASIPSFDFQARLRLVPPPVNDNFADRQRLTVVADSLFSYRSEPVIVDWKGAGAEPGEPGHIDPNGPPRRSVWYSWTAPLDGFAEAGLSLANGVTALYRGQQVSQLTRVELDVQRRWRVKAGENYALAVDSQEAGPGRLFFYFYPAVAVAIESPGSFVRRPAGPVELVVLSGSTVAQQESQRLTLEIYTNGTLARAVVRPSYPERLLLGDLVSGLTEVLAVARLDSGLAATSAPVRIEITTQPPVNDNFANRPRLTGASLLLTGYDFMAATREPDEPLALPFGRGETVWWEWTAPTNGWLYGDVYGDPLPAVVGIYRGDSLTNLTQLSASWSTGISDQAVPARYFPVRAGEAYQIQADRPQPLADRFLTSDLRLSLQLAPAPTHDDFARREPLNGASVTDQTTQNWGTSEPGEPQPADGLWLRSLWWSWTAPVDGLLAISPVLEVNTDGWLWRRPEGQPPPALAVYQGTNLATLQPLAFSTNGSVLRLPVAAGVTYQLEFAETADAPQSLPAGVELDFSSLQLIEPVRREFWEGEPVEMRLSDPRPELDHALVWADFTLDGRLVSHRTEPPFAVSLTNLPAGVHVLSVALLSEDGKHRLLPEITLRVRPCNDDYARRDFLEGTRATLAGRNLGGTFEAGEQFPPGAGQRSLWWAWIAPADGLLYLEDSGSVFEPSVSSPTPHLKGPLVSVWQGQAVSNLTLLATNLVAGPEPDSWQVVPGLILPVVGGTEYAFAVDGVNGSAGEVRLDLQFHPRPTNDDFARATVWNCSTDFASGSVLQAGAEQGEPAHGGPAALRSLWWRWTAPAPGHVRLLATTLDEPVLLAAYLGESFTALTPLARGTNSVETWVAAGETLNLALDGGPARDGRFELALDFLTIADNDAFAAAAILGDSSPFLGVSAHSSREAGEPVHVLPSFGPVPGGSLWWRWTAPGSGQATVSLTAGSAATVLVYAGDTLASLTPLAAGRNALQFYARSGETYHLAIVTDDRLVAGHFTGPPAEPAGSLRPATQTAPDSYRFTIAGVPGQSFVVLTSEDLLNWETAAIETLQGTQMELEEAGMLPGSHRFYRVLSLEEALSGGVLPQSSVLRCLRRVVPAN